MQELQAEQQIRYAVDGLAGDVTCSVSNHYRVQASFDFKASSKGCYADEATYPYRFRDGSPPAKHAFTASTLHTRVRLQRIPEKPHSSDTVVILYASRGICTVLESYFGS